MAGLSSLHVLLLAFVLSLSACKKDEQATSTIAEVTALTDEMVKAVTEATDKKAGVAKAQALLDARKDELSARMKAVGELTGMQLSEEAQNAILTGRTDNMAKVAQLEDDLLTELFKDEALETALEALIDDHEALIKGELGGQ